MKLMILPGQRLEVDGEWKLEGETVEITDAYQAQVLVASDVAAPATTKQAPPKAS